jgi:hypothetical protein
MTNHYLFLMNDANGYNLKGKKIQSEIHIYHLIIMVDEFGSYDESYLYYEYIQLRCIW